MQINRTLLFRATDQHSAPCKPPVLPKGVVPDSIAMDSQSNLPLYAWANQQGLQNTFPGYAALGQLSQISEYRAPVETVAKEMTRRWIKFTTLDDGDKTAQIQQIEQRFKDLNIRDAFRRLSEIDGFFGRAQLYISIKGNDDDKTPLIVDVATIPKGTLLGFQTVEPIWTSPCNYNSSHPTRSDFYKPESWYVLSREVHSSRLLTFISRPVTDILKPSYNFGGVSLSQLMTPYVQQWFSTRDHVSDLLRNFSTCVLKTNLASVLAAGTGEELTARAQLFNQHRDNKGLMLVDKDSEDFANITTPLSGLHELQAQAQEHMCAPSHMPLVKLTGITPSGLNASSDGEIQVWYDHLHSEQEVFFRPHLTTVLQIVQLDLFGAIDPAIDFEFVPMDEPTAAELAAERKSDADAGCAYVDRGIVSPDEERERLAGNPSSGYTNLSGPAPGPPLDESADKIAADSWEEAKHPRDAKGKFGAKEAREAAEYVYEQILLDGIPVEEALSRGHAEFPDADGARMLSALTSHLIGELKTDFSDFVPLDDDDRPLVRVSMVRRAIMLRGERLAEIGHDIADARRAFRVLDFLNDGSDRTPEEFERDLRKAAG